ncbi:hypothetical protein C4D60_Mb04t34270 [Musa balbisiana]|uniref:Uncharacterized protein n=1 Tax=Musa balbisiana TaxID=52838 RepID=A0A4S8KGP1_MUSBA|nr:hypothetical protein C4D60_Mb04t34270 [Musa balbisiana]
MIGSNSRRKEEGRCSPDTNLQSADQIARDPARDSLNRPPVSQTRNQRNKEEDEDSDPIGSPSPPTTPGPPLQNKQGEENWKGIEGFPLSISSGVSDTKRRYPEDDFVPFRLLLSTSCLFLLSHVSSSISWEHRSIGILALSVGGSEEEGEGDKESSCDRRLIAESLPPIFELRCLRRAI